ncbi:MAG: LuxR C-terminal-related transcriptional regulator [Candidatus Dormibacteraceae bacterium]
MTTEVEQPLRVLVIEDQTFLRRRLVERLAGCSTLRVVGEGGDGLEACRLACMRHPDAILLDFTLPDGPCTAQIQRLRRRFPQLAIVVLHANPTSREATQALTAGASAVVGKEADAGDLEAALRGAPRHDAPRPSTITIVPPPAPPVDLPLVASHRLTEREVTVLLLVAKAASNRQIASQLDIREKTVRNHVWHLCAKLGLESRQDAAGVVASLGLSAIA